MANIDLPRPDWLLNKHGGHFVTNTYSGSLGTPPDNGCIRARTFNYRVYADTSGSAENEFRLIAESYVIQPWHLGGNKTDFERSEFDCSEHGVEQAGAWLSEMATKYGF